MRKRKKSEKTTYRRTNRKEKPSIPAPVFSKALFHAVMNEDIRNKKPTGDDFDMLMRFVIFKESPDHPAYKENPLTGEEIRSIQKKCAENTEWAKVLTDLHREYRHILDSLEQSSFSHVPSYQTPIRTFPKKRFQLFPLFSLPEYRFPRLAIISAATLIIIFGVLAGTSSFITPQYFNATSIAPVTFTARDGPAVLGPGIDALHRKDYRTALISFQYTIDKNPASDEALLALYLSGSIHLTIAHRSFFGLFPSFEPLQVDSGIANLTSVVQKIGHGGKIGFLEEQCHFLLAKAWLMKRNVPKAREELELVLQFQGPQKHESTWILSLLPPQ